MSLFENGQFTWRETYFVLFDEKDRPPANDVKESLACLGARYEIRELRASAEGRFESLTLFSPDDYAAMDITYVVGEEVLEQGAELAKELKGSVDTPEDMAKLERLPRCNARLDLFHFEQRVAANLDEDEEEFLDPGSLLIVLEQLVDICKGIGVDPAAGALM